MEIKHTYLIKNEEFINSPVGDISREERKMGFEYSRIDITGEYVILTYTPSAHPEDDIYDDYYDIFVKWNDDEKEHPYMRVLKYNEMIDILQTLLRIRKNHFKFKNSWKRYPEYVRVE